MRLLLDTQAFLWYITSDPKLPQYASDAIRNKSNAVYLSVVSVWEALVKFQIGKLPLPSPPDEYLSSRRLAHRIENLDLELGALSQLLSLPPHHRDPFDRMLICQARHHELTFVTTDELLPIYPVAILRP
ncbi:MAG TPA: type II toxin-antitoxin system VapC family toxin [Thermoanaerobaculia bacterium]|nr:type II toxin-antitoxin system VapC family toxin [Thermoanaerobaculia bacterium]